ncbi:Alpha-L-fucosidase [Arachis hypogaea]|nr:Alpha-L-fucosidase [Arachis hypogaea]
MEYFFHTWFSLIHQLHPAAIIFSDAGLDTRWVGNELGLGASTCWSIYNSTLTPIGGIYNDPQYAAEGDPAGHEWVPALCDVSIRPGWKYFYTQHCKHKWQRLLRCSKKPLLYPAESTMFPNSTSKQPSFGFNDLSSTPMFQTTPDVQSPSMSQGENVSTDLSIWLKEKWNPGEIPEEAPPDSVVR